MFNFKCYFQNKLCTFYRILLLKTNSVGILLKSLSWLNTKRYKNNIFLAWNKVNEIENTPFIDCHHKQRISSILVIQPLWYVILLNSDGKSIFFRIGKVKCYKLIQFECDWWTRKWTIVMFHIAMISFYVAKMHRKVCTDSVEAVTLSWRSCWNWVQGNSNTTRAVNSMQFTFKNKHYN